MNEWDVVLVIVAIVGLFFSVGKPIINLNTNIATLNAAIQDLKKDQGEYEARNKDAHKRLWEHNEKQDDELEKHRLRLHDLDGK